MREGFTLRLFPGRPRRSFLSAAAFFGGILCLFLAKGKGVVVKRREEEREMRRERRRDNVVVSVVVNGCPDQRRNFHVDIEIQSQTGLEMYVFEKDTTYKDVALQLILRLRNYLFNRNCC